MKHQLPSLPASAFQLDPCKVARNGRHRLAASRKRPGVRQCRDCGQIAYTAPTPPEAVVDTEQTIRSAFAKYRSGTNDLLLEQLALVEQCREVIRAADLADQVLDALKEPDRNAAAVKITGFLREIASLKTEAARVMASPLLAFLVITGITATRTERSDV